MRASNLILAVLLSSGVAMADDKALDVTIKVVESPADLPSAVTRTIKLPPAAAQKAREQPANSGPGSGNPPGQSAGKGVGQNIVGENAPGKGQDKKKEKKDKKK
jgi:hypothetical protein